MRCSEKRQRNKTKENKTIRLMSYLTKLYALKTRYWYVNDSNLTARAIQMTVALYCQSVFSVLSFPDLNTNLFLVQNGKVAAMLKRPILTSLIPPIDPQIKDMKFKFNASAKVRTPFPFLFVCLSVCLFVCLSVCHSLTHSPHLVLPLSKFPSSLFFLFVYPY